MLSAQAKAFSRTSDWLANIGRTFQPSDGTECHKHPLTGSPVSFSINSLNKHFPSHNLLSSLLQPTSLFFPPQEEKFKKIMSDTVGQVIKCKAAVCWAAGEELKIEEIEVAPPKANEVRIRILHTGTFQSLL